MHALAVIQICQFESPLGRIAVAERRRKVIAVGFRGMAGLKREHPELWGLDEVREDGSGPSAAALRLYMKGRSSRLRVPVDWSLVRGHFDRIVLGRLMKIPPGATVTYGELAALVESPGAARAVGGAMRRNPIPIIVPCHRVLPAHRGVGNYTGGVDKKIWLLDREGVRFDAVQGTPRASW